MTFAECVDRKRYPSVGHCIYCGATAGLTDEHTIPFALNGTLVLPASSCTACSRITSAFERTVLRGPIRQVRVYRKLRSRRKHHDAPTTKDLDVIWKDGTKESVAFGFADSPVVYTFPLFAAPAHINPDGYTGGIRLTGTATYRFGRTPKEVADSLGAASVTWTESHQYTAFARLIAKIAYSTAIGQCLEAGMTPFDGEPFILSALLGKSDDIGRWVGTLTKPCERHDSQLHRVQFGKLADGKTVVAEVQLFADSGAPHYGVILGESAT